MYVCVSMQNRCAMHAPVAPVFTVCVHAPACTYLCVYIYDFIIHLLIGHPER